MMSEKHIDEIDMLNTRVTGEDNSDLATHKIFPGILSQAVAFLWWYFQACAVHEIHSLFETPIIYWYIDFAWY